MISHFYSAVHKCNWIIVCLILYLMSPSSLDEQLYKGSDSPSLLPWVPNAAGQSPLDTNPHTGCWWLLTVNTASLQKVRAWTEEQRIYVPILKTTINSVPIFKRCFLKRIILKHLKFHPILSCSFPKVISCFSWYVLVIKTQVHVPDAHWGQTIPNCQFERVRFIARPWKHVGGLCCKTLKLTENSQQSPFLGKVKEGYV